MSGGEVGGELPPTDHEFTDSAGLEDVAAVLQPEAAGAPEQSVDAGTSAARVEASGGLRTFFGKIGHGLLQYGTDPSSRATSEAFLHTKRNQLAPPFEGEHIL